MPNYFDLFVLNEDFSIDKNQLEQSYQKLISRNHPDKFSHKTGKEKSLALQNTSLINTAYQTLFDDLKRAKYLLELAGINAFDEKDTTMDVDFLMAQIEYRECLEGLEADKNIDEIEGFVDKMYNLEKQHIANIDKSFTASNLEKVKQNVRELRFYQQLKNHANALLDELE